MSLWGGGRRVFSSLPSTVVFGDLPEALPKNGTPIVCTAVDFSPGCRRPTWVPKGRQCFPPCRRGIAIGGASHGVWRSAVVCHVRFYCFTLSHVALCCVLLCKAGSVVLTSSKTTPKIKRHPPPESPGAANNGGGGLIFWPTSNFSFVCFFTLFPVWVRNRIEVALGTRFGPNVGLHSA